MAVIKGKQLEAGLADTVHTKDDKGQAVGSPTSGDDASTALTITNTPSGDGHVEILINGIQYELGDGAKTKDCYFSGDGGTTARAIAAIVATDVLFWNGVISGFDLATDDRIDFNYNA